MIEPTESFTLWRARVTQKYSMNSLSILLHLAARDDVVMLKESAITSLAMCRMMHKDYWATEFVEILDRIHRELTRPPDSVY